MNKPNVKKKVKRISKTDQALFDQVTERIGLNSRSFTEPMRRALVTIGLERNYVDAAKAAKTDVETVREWAHDPVFIDQIGRFIICLAELSLED